MLINLPFEEEVFRSRLSQVRHQMEKNGIDVLLVTVPENTYYLTGFDTAAPGAFNVLALGKDGESKWIVRKTDLSNTREYAAVGWTRESETVGVEDHENPVETLAGSIDSMCKKDTTIGVELLSQYFTAKHIDLLRKLLPDTQIVDSSNLLDELRAVKSGEELAYMKRAGEIASDAITDCLPQIHQGILDSEIGSLLISGLIRHGSGPVALGPHVTTGRRSYLPHSSWIGRKVQPGELINMELSANVRRYGSPIFRIASIGEPAKEVRNFHDASRAGLMAGIEKIKPGMTSGEADSIIRNAVVNAGYGDYFVIRAGYSIGIGFPPSWSGGAGSQTVAIKPNDPRILMPGMCFHLVPALYHKDIGAVCCSMPVTIGNSGCIPLASIEPELLIV